MAKLTNGERRKPTDDRLPPHSPEGEAGLIACALLSPALITDELQHVRPELFYDVRHATLWRTMRAMAHKKFVVDSITLYAQLKKEKLIDEVGGQSYLNILPDQAPSGANWKYYLDIVKDRYALRQTIQVCSDTVARAMDWEGDASTLLIGVGADLETLTGLERNGQKPVIEILTTDDLSKYKAPEHLRLIGDNEICMGYEGISIMAGPGGVGKSMEAFAAALAGAIGEGTWNGRAVHRQFTTMILQAENGKGRLKLQAQKAMELHPKHKNAIKEHIIFSAPPEGGLAFHRPEFRSAVRLACEKHKPQLVVLDTWAQVAAEDAAKDVMDKLSEIRSCFPSGDDCPALMIVAHTSKPRPEQVRKGRALANLVSGSIALINTARTVHMLLPWSEDLTDDRVYFACPKLNNGQMYEASVWRRRFGTFFEHDNETDAKTWGEEPKKEAERAITEEMLATAFGSESVLTKTAVTKRMQEKFNVPTSTTYAALPGGARGYLEDVCEVTKEGWIQLIKEK